MCSWCAQMSSDDALASELHDAPCCCTQCFFHQKHVVRGLDRGLVFGHSSFHSCLLQFKATLDANQRTLTLENEVLRKIGMAIG